MHSGTPRGRSPLGRIASILCLALALLVLGGLCYEITIVRGRYLALFGDFDVDLPHITMLVFQVTNPAFVAGVAGVALLLVLKEVFIRDSRLTITLNLAATVAALGVAVLFALAMALPLESLVTQLQ